MVLFTEPMVATIIYGFIRLRVGTMVVEGGHIVVVRRYGVVGTNGDVREQDVWWWNDRRCNKVTIRNCECEDQMGSLFSMSFE